MINADNKLNIYDSIDIVVTMLKPQFFMKLFNIDSIPYFTYYFLFIINTHSMCYIALY